MTQLNASQPIVFDDGTMQQPFREQMNRLNSALPITGTGSPEGVVTAAQFTLYLDVDGAAGNIEYRKMLSDIGGDKSKGWRQV